MQEEKIINEFLSLLHDLELEEEFYANFRVLGYTRYSYFISNFSCMHPKDCEIFNESWTFRKRTPENYDILVRYFGEHNPELFI